METTGSVRLLLEQAWQIEDRHGFSWWDSLIVAAAIGQGCIILLTEDLHHGQIISDLRVVNPSHLDFQPDLLS